MSSTSRIGTPLRINWANVRENRDMQILCTSGPNTGSFSLQRSDNCLPRFERRKARAPKIVPPIPKPGSIPLAANESRSRRSRNCVGAGSLAPKSLKISPKIGTTRTIRKVVMANAMQTTMTG